MPFDISVVKKICPTSEAVGEKTSYSTDSSTIKGEVLGVAWPTDYDQLKMLLKYASREEIPIVPRGGGTSLVGGAVPQKALVVDLSRLNKIKKLFLNEKTVIVQAGVVLDKLNKSIAEYNLEFPVKPCSHSSCTIGGMIGTNAAGKGKDENRRMKKWVKSITFLDGAGRVYNLDKNDALRFIGTEGCCGIMIEAVLYLDDKKELTSDLFKFEDFNKLIDKVKELKEDKDVESVMYINRLGSEIAGLGGQEHLLVRYSGKKRGSLEPSEAAELWRRYENLYSILVRAGYPRVEDALFEKDVDKFIDWINKQGFPCYGNIAAGSVHPHLQNLAGVEKVANIVSELKGQMVGEYGVGLLRRKYAPFGVVHNIRELKSKYDPKSIMNKGKVL